MDAWQAVACLDALVHRCVSNSVQSTSAFCIFTFEGNMSCKSYFCPVLHFQRVCEEVVYIV